MLLVQTGQLDAYRENCRKSVELFGGTTNLVASHRIAKDCLILPASGVNLDSISRMVDASMAEGQNVNNRWFQCCKGLADYRQNHFTRAADWMTTVLTNGGSFLEVDTTAYMVLAMSQWRLQHIEQARAALAAGTEAEQKLGRLDSGNLGEEWIDWIIAESLMREAKALIEGDVRAGGQPK